MESRTESSEAPKRLFVSFSGGETSAYMAAWIKGTQMHRYDEVVFVFANTGQEHEATLEFVDRVDREFSLGVRWIEADINVDNPAGSGFREVSLATANRDGAIFAQVCRAYGLPNPSWPHCTRELKTRPMTKYIRSLGWRAGTYDTAIGIRSDELDRVNPRYREKRLWYPLAFENPMTKPDINAFWKGMDFRLQLRGYQGNCKWCWKKSLRKHITLIRESPEIYDVPRELERRYGHINPRPDLPRRVFFRGNRSVDDLFVMAAESDMENAIDDAELDISHGCTESCEVQFDDLDLSED